MNYTAIKNKRPKYDKKWFAAFHDFGFPNIHKLFLSEADANLRAKKKFLANPRVNPHYIYSFPVKDVEPTKIAEELKSIAQKISQQEKNRYIQRAYLDRVAVRWRILGLVEASIAGNDILFSRFAKKLYSAPTKKEYQTAKQSVLRRLDGILGVRQQRLLEKVQNHFKHFHTKANKPIADKDWEVVRDALRYEADPLTSLVPNKEILSDRQIQRCFKTVLQHMQINDWLVRIDSTPGRVGISVNRDGKQVVIPKGRTVSRQRLMSLVLHEIGTHVLRANNGYSSRLQLFGSGLRDYKIAEEGIASLRHISQNDSLSTIPGDMYIVCLGLAQGLEGSKRDFSSVYNFLLSYYTLRAQLKQERPPKDWAQETAYKYAYRIFRGTSGQTAGACFTGDVVYFRGFFRIFQFILKHPELSGEYLNIGKFDPTNKQHVALLKGLKII